MRTKLFIVAALLISFIFVGICGATNITFHNCTPGTWVGGVKWVWKDGIRGNYMGSTYEDVPELELKGVGSLTVDLEPGDYAITQYRPRQIFQQGDKIVVRPSAIVDFVEISVGADPFDLVFGGEYCN